MSQHSDEQQPSVSSDSFWEPGNYKRTARRIDDGYRLCNELATMITERSEMEKNYAKGLRAWAKKWSDLIEKGPEYGTMQAAWKGVLAESDRLCDLHIKIRDNLCNDVVQQLRNWQKEAYHKSMIQIKERKEIEEAFKKAQKPWCKLLTRVEKSRTEYHTACKQQRSAINQERNAAGDTSLSPDQIKKMQERVTKSKDDVSRWREKYEASLKEIDAYNARYMEDMSVVFERCQIMEAQRLTFFKEILFSVHKCLNVSQDPVLPQIYEEFYHTVNNADQQKDLKWWSNNHGVNMAMQWPQFEEYTEEFRDIAKGKSKESIPAGPITLINQRPVGEDLHELPPVNNKPSSATTKSVNSGTGTLTNNKDKVEKTETSSTSVTDKKPTISSPQKTITNGTGPARIAAVAPSSAPVAAAAPPTTSATNNKENPFDEEEWDEDGVDGGAEPLTDTGEPGVPVRALYNYDGAESDELTFRQGDLFEKLEDEDEQGWCKGRKDGRVGLYPANYVEPVGH